jgi:hypothetical protein
MAVFDFKTNEQWQEIMRLKTQPMTTGASADPIFGYFPVVQKETDRLRWEQKDLYAGLQQARGLGTPFRSVAQRGSRIYEMMPGYYGDRKELDERQMTQRAALAGSGPININDLISEAQDELLVREVALKRHILWTLVVTGTFSIADGNRVIYTDTYPVRQFAGSDWSNLATATPLADLRQNALRGRGFGATFGQGSTAVMNQQTANYLFGNANAADLGGRRVGSGSTANGLLGVTSVLSDELLPNIQIMDDTWTDDAGAENLFLPDDKVVVFGRRGDGQPLGSYTETINANNYITGGSVRAGAFSYVKTDEEPPVKVEVFQGHNGGVELWYPGSIIVLSV